MVGFKDYSFGYGFSDNVNSGGTSLTLIGDSRDETGVIEESLAEGGNTGGSAGVTITENQYILNLTSNIKGAVVLINGQISALKTPSKLKISKKDLIENGDKIITITKNGYTSNDKYVVSLSSNGQTLIKSPFYFEGYGNLTKTGIVVKHYINDIEIPIAFQSGNIKNLSFKLTNLVGDDVNTLVKKNLTISLSGIENGNPILLRKNGFPTTDMFPTMGITKYSDKATTKYKIESSDLSLYRITKITYNDELSKQIPLVANDTESLEISFRLTTDYSISIEVEAIPKVEPLIKPAIELLDNTSRLYNINTEIGVPLAFKKNSSVKAITIIVGDDILEFDDLEAGDIAGVTIPHSTFEKIGKYNIKIFPFSLNDYESDTQTITPVKPIKVKPIKVKPIYDIKEQPTPPKLADPKVININPYIKNVNYLPTSGLYGFNNKFNLFGGFKLNTNLLNNYR